MSISKIGIHRVRHGNVMEGVDALMMGDRADIFYVDPPWGQGNLSMWSTLNKKDTGEEVQQPTLDAFVDNLMKIAKKYADRYILVEYGLRWKDQIQDTAASYGFRPHGVIDRMYRSGSKLMPQHLHLFSVNGAAYPDGYAMPIIGTFAYNSVYRAVKPIADIVRQGKPQPILLDPCCGLGYSAWAAVDNQLAFRGNELNNKRLQQTIRKLTTSSREKHDYPQAA